MLTAKDSLGSIFFHPLERTKIYLLVAGLLILAWIGLDYILEKQTFYLLLTLRLIFSTIALSTLAFFHQTDFFKKYHLKITFAFYYFLTFAMLPTVLITENFHTYSSGFSLIFIGTAAFVIWPAKYTISPFILLFPLIALYGVIYPENVFKVFNFAFLLFNISIIAFFCSWFMYSSASKQHELTMRLEQLSNEDGLTQIANRRVFDEYMKQEWLKAIREKQYLSLILCDIDYFKNYNDFYGHQQGDECLKTVAKAIDENARRPSDLAARYGGEEFVVVLPNTDSDGALNSANNIIRSISRLEIPHEKSPISQYLTVSLGVVSILPGTENQLKDLIEHTDQALYRSKEEGRNRISVDRIS